MAATSTAVITELEIAGALPGAAKSVEALSAQTSAGLKSQYAAKPANAYSIQTEAGKAQLGTTPQALSEAVTGANSATVTSETSALQRIAANNKVETSSSVRMARIDELSQANWGRRIDEMINSQDYVFAI